MENPLIRTASRADMPAVLEIYNEVVANTTAIYDDSQRGLEQQMVWFETKEQSGFPIFVSEIDGRVAGYGTYGPFRPWACYRPTVELGLHVSASMRGRGLGRAMLSHLISDAKRREFHSMMAGIDAGNSASLKLHAQFGFREVGRIPQVAYKFDRWLDLVFMQLLL